ncbi:MAG TPA: STAS domain-containing protein [Candidatus Acidoferrum sp.]|nr:STAS domain-containing protein [Candidatus Acidoferrum sp.]
MGLQLTMREAGRVVVVDAVGRLTLTDGHTKLRDAVHVFAGNGSKKFLLNLAGLDFVDSYGIGELARCYSTVRRAGGDIKLVAVQPRVLEVLSMSRLTTVFQIYSAEDVALESFARRP